MNKILIVTTTSASKTVTFIKNQIKYFGVSDVLHDEFRPYLHNDKSIFNFPYSINLFRKLLKRLSPKKYTEIYRKTLTLFLKEKKFDMVLCNYGTYGANIADACHSARVPFIVHFHGYDAFVHKTVREYASKYRNMFGKAAFVIAVSSDMKQQLIQLGAPGEKVILCPYGVDTTLFAHAHPSENGRTLLFVGRFTAKKNPVSLLRAFHYARQSVPDARLVMIGRGELQKQVSGAVNSLNLQNSVTLMGAQPPETVARQMQQARAYVQHSVFAPNGDSEGSPVSIMEAASSGLPVISTRHAGIKETVIDWVTGYLVDEGDWQAMGKHMITLLNDPALAGKMGEAGRKHILENYDIRTQMNELKSIMEKAIKQSR
jgi:glycosyltransferase involved in cell wall biosynthesis